MMIPGDTESGPALCTAPSSPRCAVQQLQPPNFTCGKAGSGSRHSRLGATVGMFDPKLMDAQKGLGRVYLQ